MSDISNPVDPKTGRETREFLEDVLAWQQGLGEPLKQVNIGKLTGTQYQVLRSEARKRGLSIPQLCREAVLDRYAERIDHADLQREILIAKAETQLASYEVDQ